MIQISQVAQSDQGENPAKIEAKPTEEPVTTGPALPPRTSEKRLTVIIGIAGVLFILASVRVRDVKWLFEHLLPYAQSIGGAAIAIMVLLYKDLKSYRHPGAALTVLCAILLFSGLTALNTYNEREQKLRDKSAADEKAEALAEKIDQTKEQVAKNAQTTATSIGRLSGDLNDFKADVKPAELRSQMTVMKDELEKTQAALSPPPKATLLFSFFPFINPPFGRSPAGPVTNVDLPIGADGSIHVQFTVLNLTDIDAVDGELTLQLCDVCKFAEEPAEFTRLPGDSETQRYMTFQRLLASVALRTLTADITVPDYIEFFNVGIGYRCHTCVLNKEISNGIVHVLKPFHRAIQGPAPDPFRLRPAESPRAGRRP
jgi:hypothetical protein